MVFAFAGDSTMTSVPGMGMVSLEGMLADAVKPARSGRYHRPRRVPSSIGPGTGALESKQPAGTLRIFPAPEGSSPARDAARIHHHADRRLRLRRDLRPDGARVRLHPDPVRGDDAVRRRPRQPGLRGARPRTGPRPGRAGGDPREP